jgi:hypothetical protein
MAGKGGLAFEDMDVVDFAVGLLSQKRRLPGFGNAGSVASMLNVAKVNKSGRIAAALRSQREAALRGGGGGGGPSSALLNPDVLIKSDFATEELSAEKGKDAFSKLINVDHIKKILFELEAVIIAAKEDGRDPADILADRLCTHASMLIQIPSFILRVMMFFPRGPRLRHTTLPYLPPAKQYFCGRVPLSDD